jgi:hypothetical protein
MFRVIVTVGLLLFALAAKKLVTWRNHIRMARTSGFVVRKSPWAIPFLCPTESIH